MRPPPPRTGYSHVSEERQARVVLPPPERPPSIRAALPRDKSQTILAIATLIGALFGGAGIGSVYQREREGISRDQAQALREDLRQFGSELRELREYLQQANAGEVERWDITTGIICRLNGGIRFARGVSCDAIPQWSSPALDSAVGWQAKADWVPPRRPPY